MTQPTQNTFKISKLLALLLAGFLGFAPAILAAASLGKLEVLSALGAPLKAEIEVENLTAEEEAGFTAKIASAELFRQAKLDFNPVMSNMRVTLVKRPNGKNVLELSSATAVNEPLLDTLIEVNWATGKLVREYTVLLDPSVNSDTVVSAPPVLQAAQALPLAVPLVVNAAAPQVTAPPQNSAPVAKVLPTIDGSVQQFTQYLVKPNDTLYSIAKRMTQGSGIELSQALADIYAANPNAFVNGDVNRVKEGVTLNLPAKNSVNKLTETAAGPSNSVVAPAKKASSGEFAEYKQAVSRKSTKKAKGKKRNANKAVASKRQAGKVTTEQKDAASMNVQPKVKVSKEASLKGDGTAAGQLVKKNTGVEAKVATDRANKENESRLAELNANTEALRKEVALGNDKLAAAEKAAKAAALAKATAPVVVAVAPIPAPTPTPAPIAAPAPKQLISAVPSLPASAAQTPVVQPPVVQAPAAALPATPAPAEAIPGGTPPVAALPSAPSAPVAPKLAVKRAPPPPPPPAPEWYENIDPLVAGGGAGVVGLLGLLWYSRRKKKTANDFADSQLGDEAPNSILAADGGRHVDTANSIFSSSFAPINAQIDAGEVDPIAEADVYLAYGRDTHAEEILRDALTQNPANHAARAKLLEIFVTRKDKAAFDKEYAELQKQTRGEGEFWKKSTELANKFGGTMPTGFAPDASTTLMNTRTPTNKVAAAMISAPTLVSPVTQIMPPNAALAQRPALDLNVPSLNLPAKQPAAALRTAAALGATASDLQFDATMPTPDFKPSIAVSPDSRLGDGLSVKLDFDVARPAPVKPAVSASPSPAKTAEAKLSAPSVLDFDMSSFNLEPKTTPAPAISFSPSPAAVNLLKADSKIGIDESEFSTKLNLAEAYVSIGDKEGAKELLNEVLNAPDAALVAKAKSLLATL